MPTTYVMLRKWNNIHILAFSQRHVSLLIPLPSISFVLSFPCFFGDCGVTSLKSYKRFPEGYYYFTYSKVGIESRLSH